MEEMNQRRALGVSLKAFAALMIAVCFIYQVTTRSVGFANIWFSYLVGAVLYTIGCLMSKDRIMKKEDTNQNAREA